MFPLMPPIFQFIYLCVLSALAVHLIGEAVHDKYASRAGSLLALIGAGAVLLGMAGVAMSVPGILHVMSNAVGKAAGFPTQENFLIFEGYTAAEPFAPGAVLAWTCVLWGWTAFYAGVRSWLFTHPDKRALRLADIAEAEQKDAEMKAFQQKGTLVSVRNRLHNDDGTAARGALSVIETTEAVFLVQGTVGSVTKGIPVYLDGKGRVRVGTDISRIFHLHDTSKQHEPALAALAAARYNQTKKD